MAIPESWKQTELGEVLLSIIGGGTPSKSIPSYYEGSIPWMSVKDMNKNILHDTVDHISEEAVKNSSTNLIPSGTPIVATRMSLGKIVVANFDSAINQDLKALFPATGVNREYLIGWYRSISRKVEELGTGTTVKGIRLEVLKSLEFPLPPRAEQKVIADKLDTLLGQVETTKARLKRIPEILKIFRQSVLAAAVSGKLTEDWRGCCSTKLEEFTKEPKLTEFRGQVLPLLPASWQWLRFDQVADIASNLTNPLDNPEAIHIAPNHIESWTGVVSGFQTIAADGVTSAKHQFTQGQIIYSKIRPYLAKVTIAEFDGLCSADMYPINSRINTRYIFRWMLTSEFTEWASNAESRSVLPKINQKDLNKIPVPTPSLKEQTEIVHRVEELFTLADSIEHKANAALERVDNLTQSILAKAFRGDLTAEWRAANPELISGDNSAEVLLAKSKAERVALKKQAKKITTARKKA